MSRLALRWLAPWWLRARWRAAPGGAAAFGALVLVTAFVAAALPRAVDASADDALAAALDRARPGDRLLSATTVADSGAGSPGELRELLSPGSVRAAERAVADAVKPPLRVDRTDAAYGVHNASPADSDTPGLPRPSRDLDPKATLVAQAGLGERARVTEGRLPDGRTRGAEGKRRVQAAVSAATARTMKLRPGDSFRLPSGFGHTTVEVTGIVTPRGTRQEVRGSAFWNAEESMARPTLVTVPQMGGSPKKYWHFTAYISPRTTPALLDLRDGAELFWHYPVVRGSLRAHQVPGIQRELTALADGAGATRLQDRAGVGTITFDAGLSETFGAFRHEQDAISPLLLIAGLGLATTGGTVLLLAGVLAAERRREECVLLRSRGASLRGLAGRLLAETASVAVPAGALGAGLALLVTDGTRVGSALLAAAAATAVAALALPVRAALGQRRVRVTAAREDVTRARPSRRRTVVELTVLALVVGAVVAVRQRGTSDGDALLALAPVLLALAAALLLSRCYPLPLRLLSRAANRRPGPVAFLGLARAGRAPSAAVSGLALIALLVALTVASFGGTVLAGIAHGRDTAALRAVGADARIAAPENAELTASLAARARELPGVDEATGFRLNSEAELTGADAGVTVVLADADSYSRLARDTGQGAFPARALGGRGDSASGAVPALVSPGLQRRMGGEPADLVLPGFQLRVRAALARERTPAALSGAFVVLSRETVARAHPDARGTALLAPNTVLVSGDSPDTGALRALVRRSDAENGLRGDNRSALTLRSHERARFADTVLQSGAERLYTAAVLAATGYSALAVLLSLLQNAPDRIALLSRLRTLGLPRRQARGVLLLESLPLYALTACAGVLTGLATVPLLEPGIDLTALAGTPDDLPVRLSADPVSLVLPPLALLAPAVAGALVQARLAGRGTHDLRMEQR
ncbi:FtsX-like permease family protein [Streptomyces albiaxialis]|uniref:FtsX-like permease family protein n=1 Tax=Streptomyces albiaxialis TaxID=329523 RepID=A0ABP5I1D8_9ACTN